MQEYITKFSNRWKYAKTVASLQKYLMPSNVHIHKRRKDELDQTLSFKVQKYIFDYFAKIIKVSRPTKRWLAKETGNRVPAGRVYIGLHGQNRKYMDFSMHTHVILMDCNRDYMSYTYQVLHIVKNTKFDIYYYCGWLYKAGQTIQPGQSANPSWRSQLVFSKYFMKLINLTCRI